MLEKIKTYPIAIGIFTLYILCLVWLCFIGYHVYTGHGDGETIGMNLFGFTLLFFIPYLAGLTYLSIYHKTRSKFYTQLAYATLILAILTICSICGEAFIK